MHELTINAPEMGESSFAKLLESLDITSSARFPAAVHSPLRSSDVDATYTEERRENWTDRGPAWAIVADNKILILDTGLVAHSPGEGRGSAGGGVPLVAVGLEHDPAVHRNFVLGLMFSRVIGMSCMCTICGYENGSGHKGPLHRG